MSLHEEVKSKLRELIPEIRGEIQRSFQLSILEIIDYVRYYSSILDTWNFSILSVPEGRSDGAM